MESRPEGWNSGIMECWNIGKNQARKAQWSSKLKAQMKDERHKSGGRRWELEVGGAAFDKLRPQGWRQS